MSKTTNKYSPEVRERAVRMVLDNTGQHESRWAAIVSVSEKIGCAAQTLNEWVKKVEVDSGKRAGVTSDMGGCATALRESISASLRDAGFEASPTTGFQASTQLTSATGRALAREFNLSFRDRCADS